MKKSIFALTLSSLFALSVSSAWAAAVQSVRQADKVRISGNQYQVYVIECDNGRKISAYNRDGQWFDYGVAPGSAGSRYNGLSLDAFAKDFCR
jgi:hypothetical protein